MEKKKLRLRSLRPAGKIKTSLGEADVYYGIMRRAIDLAGIKSRCGRAVVRHNNPTRYRIKKKEKAS